ncbi:DUF3465 domain-containing protein [Shewanella aquimarina]|uniref:DUF3465 domain-containing protein n=1 Tax=Shewanella aquimarina TaxID=260365 RepID=UPI00201499D4|nr:DUF3465 domain-containing protein [Shewanella aquimarina]MCL2909527.1 DUF3465 domain-containing protein [Shewanella aquimarina]
MTLKGKGLLFVGRVLAALVLALSVTLSVSANDAQLSQAFEQKQSGLQIQGEGKVIRLLGDDTKGSRHQRFIVRLASGQTLLVAHNIDLAPRIADLKVGDRVGFFGEYEWNNRGGVIHWTHKDPNGHHPAGWLSHNGQKYQ